VADWGFPRGGARAASEPEAIGGGSNSYGRFGGGYNNTTLGQGFVPRPPNSYGNSAGGYNTSLAHGFVHRPPNSYSRPGGGYNAALGNGFVHRPPNSYSGYGSAQNSSRGYQSSGFGYARGPLQAYNHAPSTVNRPPFASRASTQSFANFGQRPSSEFGSRGYAQSPGKQARATSFHPFGGGHGSESFHGGGGHAPKSFNGGKGFSGGHSGGGGGHSGGHSSGNHHH